MKPIFDIVKIEFEEYEVEEILKELENLKLGNKLFELQNLLKELKEQKSE